MANYNLNDEQWAAVTSPSVATMVYASAGAGKTRCLTSKIRLLIDSGVSPESILSITFTTKAAKEMKNRLKPYCPKIDAMQVSTIHSMCVRIIKKFYRHTPLKMPFSIFDDADQLSIIKTIMKSRALDEDPYDILSSISRAKSEQGEEGLTPTTAEIYHTYQEILLKNNAADFDDLLVYALKCVKQEDCRNHYTDLWRHILVDEFQDTSTVQFDIIMAFFDPGKTKTMFVVGDADQSIYGWRQAKPENIQKFIDKCKAKECHLTYNYRSCPEIINHANRFQQFGKPMVAKSGLTGSVSFTQFFNQDDEASKIAEAVARIDKEKHSEVAILYRTNARSVKFEQAFAMRRIAYKVTGDIPFYRRRVCKDLLGYCKASGNPDDIESLARIVNVPKRGFGETRQERLLKEGRPYLEWEALQMPAIRDLLDLLTEIRHKAPKDALETVIRKTGYRSTMNKESDQPMLEAFLSIAEGYHTTDELILASTFLEEDSGHGVKLMTVHASKGLEFDRVFVVGVEEGLWPHKMSEDVEEEKRLYYVAITRARKHLNISYCKSRLLRGVPIETAPSGLFLNSLKHNSNTPTL